MNALVCPPSSHLTSKSSELLADLDIFASVEGFKVKFSIRLGCPQPEIDCVFGLEAWYRVVIGNRCDLHWGSLSAELAQIVSVIERPQRKDLPHGCSFGYGALPLMLQDT